jgi:hypothetical protein
MRTAALALGFVLSLARPATPDSSLSVRLTPRVMMAPGFLTVRAMIAAHTDNRAVEVVAESPTFFRSSVVPLDGDRAPRVNEVVFRSLPEGRYEVTVALIGSAGRRAVQTGWFQVGPSPGQ